MNKYRSNVYSQFGEDGILTEIRKRIYPEGFKGVAVEFGGHNGTYCSNTALLRDQGWEVHMYDMHSQNPELVEQKTITPANVNDLPDCDILSIDCDGPDYILWACYVNAPDVVVIEVNSSIPPDVFEVPGDRGASFLAMVSLAESKGYFVVIHTANVIACLNKYRSLFPECQDDATATPEKYFDRSHL